MVSELIVINSLAKPVTYVSMVSELKEISNLARPMTCVSMVSELKEIKIQCPMCPWSAI